MLAYNNTRLYYRLRPISSIIQYHVTLRDNHLTLIHPHELATTFDERQTKLNHKRLVQLDRDGARDPIQYLTNQECKRRKKQRMDVRLG